jgi:Transposase DDE domain group 1
VLAYLAEKRCCYSVGVTKHRIVAERIALLAEEAWQPVADYPETGVCELAETTLGDQRLIVRRVHLHAQEDQTELFAYWRYFAFVTNRGEQMHTVDREHRQHAEVELAIRDLKDQALAHFPSGRFAANSAWTVIACLAHNLQRWTGMLGLQDPTPRTARTIRSWLLTIPGRLTRTARRWTLHLPARWPWQRHFIEALTRVRALPAA